MLQRLVVVWGRLYSNDPKPVVYAAMVVLLLGIEQRVYYDVVWLNAIINEWPR